MERAWQAEFVLRAFPPTAHYSTLHWKSHMRFISRVPENPLDDSWDPEKIHSFSEPWRNPGTV
jgi:hypothetical protein